MQEISRRASITGSNFLLTSGQNSSQTMFGPPLPPDHPQRANGGQGSSSRPSSTPGQEIKSSPASSSFSQYTYDDHAGPSVFSPQSQQTPTRSATLFGLFEGHPPHHDATISSSSNDYVRGLRVFTVGHLRPRENGDEDPGFFPDEETNRLGGYGGLQVPTLEELSMPRLDGKNGADGKTSPANEGFNPGREAGSSGQRRTSQTLRVRRSTYVPGWAVPPKVLLVEDESVGS
jgi:osomolarity two-component system response regulator SKN7